jgi:hypothetical protein
VIVADSLDRAASKLNEDTIIRAEQEARLHGTLALEVMADINGPWLPTVRKKRIQRQF